MEGVESGGHLQDRPDSDGRLSLLATAGMGEGGGVDLPKPITVMAGEAFIAGPEPFECGET